MFPLRCFVATSLAYGVFPRKSYASCSAVKCVKHESYREKFDKLNKEDNVLVIEQCKKELTKAFGHSHVISQLPTETIDELHYILYTKPLSPEMRILLRKKILPYLESSSEDAQKLYEYILKYYDVI